MARRRSVYIEAGAYNVCVPSLQMTKLVPLDPLQTVWETQKYLMKNFGISDKYGLHFGIYLETVDDSTQPIYLRPQSLIGDANANMDSNTVFIVRRKERIYKNTAEAKKHRTYKKKAALRQKLVEYIDKKSVSKVTDILEKGLDPNFHLENGETPLSKVVALNNVDMIRILVKYGAYTDLHTLDGQSVLHKAAELGAIVAMKTLFSVGIWVGLPNIDGHTAVTAAIKHNQLGCLGQLLDNNVPLEVIGNHKITELHMACYRGLPTAVRRLLKRGAMINAIDGHGGTCLHICAARDQVECARILLDADIDTGVINYAGQTAFKMALGLRSQATATAIAMAGGNKVGTTLQTMGDSIETIGSSTNPKQLSAKAKAFATYTYKAEQPGALSFTAGSIITIMDKDTPNADLGYWYGCTQDGKTGYFPYSMVYELNHPTPSPMSIDHYIQLQGAGLAIVKYTTLESENVIMLDSYKRKRPAPPKEIRTAARKKNFPQLQCLSYLGPCPPKPLGDDDEDSRRPSTFQTISFSRDIAYRLSMRPSSMVTPAAVDV